MNLSFSNYKVKEKDTLESVAEQLGISSEYLKRYHNTYCDLQYLIGKDLRGISEIIIPRHEEIAKLKEKQDLLSLHDLLPSRYLNKSLYARHYDVKEIFEQQNKENITIDYSLAVSFRENINNGFITEVKTSGFKKNGQDSDDKISMLSLACMETISPIAFDIPVQGKIKAFSDYKNLVASFENKRNNLEDFFIGEISEAYIDQFYKNISDENYLLTQFQSVLLYQVLFPEMEWFHRKKEWKESFFVTPHSFPVQCSFQTAYDFENTDDVEIIIKGKIEENCSLQELLNGFKPEEESKDKINGEVEMRYFTSKKTKKLKQAGARITLFNKEELYSTHHLIINAKEEEKPIKKFSTLA